MYVLNVCASIKCNYCLSQVLNVSFFLFYFASVHGCCIKTEMAGRKKSITHIKPMAEIGKFKIEKKNNENHIIFAKR